MSSFLVRLLGTPSIEDPAGALQGAAVQRHRLALLALLALAPRHMSSRERLMGLLWPEASTVNARNLLNAAVHSIRRALGEGVLLTQGGGIALDCAQLRVDVLEFQGALNGGEPARAIDLYSGPFLDGLALPGAVEFERWQESERERLQDLFRTALEQVAIAVGNERGPSAAVMWWRRRLACTPLDARVALRLMSLLVEAGDRAEALRVAAAHATLLQVELDAAPDTDVEEFADRLRRESPAARPALVPSTSDAQPQTLQFEPPAPGVGDPPLIDSMAAANTRRNDGSRDRVAVRSRLSRRLRTTVVVTLVALVVTLLSLRLASGRDGRSAGESAAIRSLALLPLHNRSALDSLTYLADGLTDALTSELGRIGSLEVRPRTTAARYRNPSLTARGIARELRVAGLVEGSAQFAGDSVRLTLALIHGETDRQIWSDTYHEHLANVNAMVRRVVLDLVSFLDLEISAAERARLQRSPPVDPRAFRELNRGNELLLRLDERALRGAIAAFSRAIAIDSAYAAAHAGLALAYAQLGSWWGSLRPDSVFPLAGMAARTSIRLDSTNADAWIALARVHQLWEWDWAGADTAYRRGIALDSAGLIARTLYANYLISMARFEDAVEVARGTIEMDWQSPALHNELGFAFDLAGHDSAALHAFRQSLEIDPAFEQTQGGLALFFSRRMMLDSLQAYVTMLERTGPPSSPATGLVIAGFYARLGEHDTARQRLGRILAEYGSAFVSPFYVAAVFACLGDTAEAIHWLEAAEAQHDMGLVWLNTMPDACMVPLRTHPRIQRLISRMNFPRVR